MERESRPEAETDSKEISDMRAIRHPLAYNLVPEGGKAYHADFGTGTRAHTAFVLAHGEGVKGVKGVRTMSQRGHKVKGPGRPGEYSQGDPALSSPREMA